MHIQRPSSTARSQLHSRLSTLVLVVLLLSGCAAFNETRLEDQLGREVNLIEFANDIADDLVREAFPPLLPRQPQLPILTTTFVDNNQLEKTSHFGRLLQEHITARFVRNGYAVKEIKLRSELVIEPQSGETILSRRLDLLKDIQPAQALLVGTLSISQRTMYISARLVNPTTADILSAGTYRLYMDKNVLAMFGLRTAGDDTDIKKPEEPLVNRIFY
ncbi:FlgO family outer membrane protein [Desulfofustis limnaeus]|uniref:FlgO domain-containing protein n=1 Tax=Desulfofustis limnaeus TaxID=2740163 RepID=A0ABM7W856_9BACT|nr:FlgO family outer membrane protein [Desulfofustis limnaeus]MDX9894553.1 FlgO family outer membrane protein [Desulfofustis sp.]BDD87059.1 hypothetical protein DPPLL_14240 [Desulfofustis limnaeus]